MTAPSLQPPSSPLSSDRQSADLQTDRRTTRGSAPSGHRAAMQDTADADACLVFGDSTPHAIMSCL
eukprot:CAMPEP_0178668262 /NCGR_PEP_ID=MMETSP0698-20121128/31488_1 /TAXON_ID=265572 /ORGANISM="Extubocellulus spinifer, Strain CCMP396" /LENGTH=65 /DNA_ID=CAMNT_0020311821 /DNA_START=185 /DNA_END=379 /DNA_ORIENTATION=-